MVEQSYLPHGGIHGSRDTHFMVVGVGVGEGERRGGTGREIRSIIPFEDTPLVTLLPLLGLTPHRLPQLPRALQLNL